MSAMERIKEGETRRKQQKLDKEQEEADRIAAAKAAPAAAKNDYWLHRGIIVKIMNKKIGGGKYRLYLVVHTLFAQLYIVREGVCCVETDSPSMSEVCVVCVLC
jgi:hypothetical protein